MFFIESFKQCGVDSAHQSLEWICRKGPVSYPFQAEMWAKQLLVDTTRRVYIWYAHRVYAILSRDPSGQMLCLAQSPDWAGRQTLPFLDETRNNLTVISSEEGMVDHDLSMWAEKELKKPAVATAIALSSDGIIHVWDWNIDGPVSVTVTRPETD
jgi:hypothetical protein